MDEYIVIYKDSKKTEACNSTSRRKGKKSEQRTGKPLLTHGVINGGFHHICGNFPLLI